MLHTGITADQAPRRSDRPGRGNPLQHDHPGSGVGSPALWAWRSLAAGMVLQSAATAAAAGGTATRITSAAYAVAAQRQPLTTSSTTVVAHDTEVEALVPHSGRLFAATGQWEYPGATAHGQVLVKKSGTGPWTIFEKTQSLRVQALDSFPVPNDQGLGPGHSLLVTQTIVAGHSVIQWLLDGADAFSTRDSFVLPPGADVRAFGSHEAGGVWSVYAGVRPTGVLQGVWSPARRTLVFNPAPELTVAPPGSPGAVTQKVTGFAECAGALYTTITTTLYRRNDGALPRASRAGSRSTERHRWGLTTAGFGASRASVMTVHRLCSSRRRATATCTDSTISREASSIHRRNQVRARCPTGWCRRWSSNPPQPSARCWRRRARSSRQQGEAPSPT